MSPNLSKFRWINRVVAIGLFSLLLSLGAQGAQATQTDGTLDTSFNSGGSGFNAGTNGVALQPDGKVIIGGSFSTYNGVVTANRLIRLNTNGSVDTSFQTGTGFAGGTGIGVIFLLQDGSMLVGGSMTSYNGVAVSNLVKLSSTGVLDQTFTSNIGSITSPVIDIKQLADGEFLATGQFPGGIIKFASSGVRNTAFMGEIGAGFARTVASDLSVYSVVQQSSGNLVLVGNFDTFKGVSVPSGIASLTNGGQLVTSFQTNVGLGLRNGSNNGFGTSLALLSSGKIIIGGNFDRLGSALSKNFIAINPDGTQYTAFNSGGAGFSRQVEYISLDASENMYVSQQGSGTYNGTSVTSITRLTSAGVLDPSFSADAASLKTVPTPTGGLYVTGFFSSYRGSPIGRFMRLETVVTPSPSPTTSPTTSPSPQPTQASDATLAKTGTDLTAPVSIALGLLVVGGVLTRLRQSQHKTD